MPGEYSTIDFYGRGPWENYIDRHSSTIVGRYIQSVNEQYPYDYPRTQEAGTKTGLRWFRIVDPAGQGLEITSEEQFSASALPFGIEDLDSTINDPRPRPNKTNAQAGNPQHSLELRHKAFEYDRLRGTTHVLFDKVQMGVGGIDSWGALPLREYQVDTVDRSFVFMIRPIGN